jgi:hypothetical protein
MQACALKESSQLCLEVVQRGNIQALKSILVLSLLGVELYKGVLMALSG